MKLICWTRYNVQYNHRHLGLAYGRREPAFNAINNVALILWRNHVARYNNIIIYGDVVTS